MAHYKLQELAERMGIAPRTIRYYVQRGLLHPPVFQGKDTVYDEEHVARIELIRELQTEERLSLEEIHLHIETKGVHRNKKDNSGSLRARSSKNAAVSSPYREQPEESRTTKGSEEQGSRAIERWERIVLFPGVELHVRADADVEGRRIALEIESQFAKRR